WIDPQHLPVRRARHPQAVGPDGNVDRPCSHRHRLRDLAGRRVDPGQRGVVEVHDPDLPLADGDTAGPVANVDPLLRHLVRQGIDPRDRAIEPVRYPDGPFAEGDAVGTVTDWNRLPDGARRWIDTVDGAVRGVRHPDRSFARCDIGRRRPDLDVRDQFV